jgi:hypothetical protein
MSRHPQHGPPPSRKSIIPKVRLIVLLTTIMLFALPVAGAFRRLQLKPRRAR